MDNTGICFPMKKELALQTSLSGNSNISFPAGWESLRILVTPPQKITVALMFSFTLGFRHDVYVFPIPGDDTEGRNEKER